MLNASTVIQLFLNPEREALPDIDIDFLRSRRQQVIDYVVDKYGQDNVAHIATFGTMGAKGALKDVGRALGYDFELMNRISKAVPAEPGISLQEALEVSPELEQYKGRYPDLFEYATKIEGRPRHISTHACAMVIAPKKVTRFVPLTSNDGEVVTQTEMDDSEALGLLKMDMLGLKTLDLIHNTLEFARERDDLDDVPETDDIWNIPLDDENVYREIYQKADTNGVFQCESRLFKGALKKMQPAEFEHIVALQALCRPGPLDAGIVDDYIACMHGEKEVEYPHPDLEETLKDTYGMMIYQENVMHVAQKIAGYSLGQADILRRAVGKKKPELMKEQRGKFIQGALENGYSQELAEELFNLIDYFSGYGFNRSHAASYSLISYITAYLKYYYPAEFYAALLSIESEKSSTESNVRNYIADCYRKGIDVLPPNINESEEDFRAVDGAIRVGFNAIKGLGRAAVEEVIDKQPYDGLADVYNRVDRRTVNKTAFESMIKAGCFDRFETNRKKLLEDYNNLRDNAGAYHMSLMDFAGMSQETEPSDVVEMEMETMNMSLSYPSEWDKATEGDLIKIKGEVVDAYEHKTSNNKLMCFVTLASELNTVDCVVFPDVYGPNNDLFTKGFVLELEGKKDEGSLLVDAVEYLDGNLYDEAV